MHITQAQSIITAWTVRTGDNKRAAQDHDEHRHRGECAWSSRHVGESADVHTNLSLHQ
jgi:hypothetical protein